MPDAPEDLSPPGSLLDPPSVDPAAVTALGAILLGVVPAAVPVDPGAWYPDGRVPADLPLPADAPPLRPRFRGRPTLDGADQVRQPVLDTLVDDATASTDRVRLAERLYAIGSLLPVGSPAAREAFMVAAANDPNHLLNDWSVRQALSDPADAKALIQHLDRADADAQRLHAAGHVARAAGERDWALDLWWNALSADSKALAPLLASYLEALGTQNTEAAGAFGEMLYEASSGALLGVLGLDRSLRAQDQLEADALRDEIHAALVQSEGSPAALAAAEEIGGRTSDDGLLADALAARLNALEPEAESSRIRAEIGVLATRLGWLRERAGDVDGALLAYARAVDHDPDAPFARRRALALGRRRENLTLVHRLLGDLAERVDLPVSTRAAALVERAAAAFRLDRPADGRTDLAQAAQTDPAFLPALQAMGRASIALSDLPGRIRLHENELAALQAQMAESDAARARLTPRVVESAIHLAGLLLEDGRDRKAALAACRIALDAAPADRSAYLAAGAIFERYNQWAALAALRVARAGVTDGVEAAECLVEAADLKAQRLNDAQGAAKLLARALKLAPAHPYVLTRAAQIFALTGHRAAWAEVEQRLGADAPHRLLRAGRLFEHGPDERGAARDAFADALQANAPAVDAIDGLTRVVARDGDASTLQAHAAHAPVEAAPRIALAAAEALIAHGGAAAALGILERLRAADRPVDGLSVDGLSVDGLYAVAAARAGAWPALADGLIEQAKSLQGAERAAALTCAGRMLAVRIGDRGEAIAAFVEALEADPDYAPAQAALQRWRPTPQGGQGDGPLDDARAARAAGDWHAHDTALRQAALDASMRNEAHALRAASGRVSADQAAKRDDLFEHFWPDEADPRVRLDALRARAQAAPAESRGRWWRRVLREAMQAEAWPLAREAAETLQSITPRSLPAALALARIGRLTGDAGVEQAALERLGDQLRHPTAKAAVAERQTAAAADPVGRARSLVLRSAWDDAYQALAPVLGPAASIDAWRLAAQIHSARGERVGALRAHEALYTRSAGIEAAEAALAVADLHAAGRAPGLATDWIAKALDAAPAHPPVITAVRSLEPRQIERLADSLPPCLEALRESVLSGGRIDRLPEMAALAMLADQPLAAQVINGWSTVFDLPTIEASVAPAVGRGLTDALWARHVADGAEDTPAARLLARFSLPIAAALVAEAPRPLVGSDAWCGRLQTFFARLGVPDVHIGLDRNGQWRAVPGPTPWVLAPARETPLTPPVRFRLGQMAAGFLQGRALLTQFGPDRLAEALGILQSNADGKPVPPGQLEPERRARLMTAARSFDAEERALIDQVDGADLTPEALAALITPFTRTAQRAGLLAAGSPAVAIEAILQAGAGSASARRRATMASPDARAVIAWSIGPDGLSAREAVADGEAV